MSGLLTGGMPMIIGGSAVAATVAVGTVVYINREPVGDQAPLPVVAIPQAQGDSPTLDQPEPDSARTEEAQPPAVEETAETSPEKPPRLQEVRLEQDGVAVVAGHASPFADLILRLDGAEVARISADSAGEFATIALLDPSPAARVLSLAEIAANGTETLSPDELILAPVVPAPTVADLGASEDVFSLPEAEDPEPQLAALKPKETPAPVLPVEEPVKATEEAPTAPEQPETVVSEAEPLPEQVEETTEVTQAPQELSSEPVAALSSAPALGTVIPEDQGSPNVTLGTNTPSPALNAAPSAPRVAVLRSSAAGVEVVRPAAPTPEVMTEIALDAISYSAAGDVELAGRAQSDTAEVRVYLNNKAVAELAVSSGDWKGAVPNIDTGVYTLRIDEVAADGRVTSRVETPFKREDPEVLTAATSNPEAAVSAVTVQTGTTLWAIARERYGEGTLYVRVFEANKGLIKDPNLIYPGQVFNLPTE